MSVVHAIWLRQAALLGIDAGVAIVCLWLAMLLRFEGRINEPYRVALPVLMAVLAVSRLAANISLRLHRWSFPFSGLPDAARLGLAGLLGTGLFMSGVYFLQLTGPPRSVVVLELLLSSLLMGMVRFSPRLATLYLTDWARARRVSTARTIILGAGAAGELLLRDLQRSGSHDYRVVGFVDDDPAKRGTIVGGRPVLGATVNLPDLAAKRNFTRVLIAIPRLPAQRIREILSTCASTKLHFKILPVSFVYLQERPATSMLQDLSPEDLLPRAAVSFAESAAASMAARRRILVTGAAGSIGSEICRQLLRAGAAAVTMVDVNENGLYMLRRRFEREFPTAAIGAEVADIRDAGRIRELVRRGKPEDVFHAAAHKHVPLMEAAPCEAVKNNILGTVNVATAADHEGAERFVLISTDKAVRPSSVMGASKRVAEMAIRAFAKRSNTRFCAVRFGNVLGSAGSVVPIFQDQIAAGGPVTVTDPEARRYFMTVAEAVGLVLEAVYVGYGELCVLNMGEPIRIADLARNMITMVGLVPDSDIRIEFTGLRPGEKLFEELFAEDEERTTNVADKIMAVQSPAPPHDTLDRVSELIDAAMSEDERRVLIHLGEMIPSYRHGVVPDGGRATSAEHGAGEVKKSEIPAVDER